MQPSKVCTLNTELPILKWDDINFDCPRRPWPGCQNRGPLAGPKLHCCNRGVWRRRGNKLKRYIPHDAASCSLSQGTTGNEMSGRGREREGKVDRIAAVVAKKMEEEESGRASMQDGGGKGDSRGHMRVINAVEERATYGLEGERKV